MRGEGPSRDFGALTAADLDSDGDQDLIGADGDNGIYVWLNPGGGFATNLRDADADVVVGTAGQDLGETLAVTDLDGDGVLDLLFGTPGNGQEVSDGGALWTADAESLLAADGLAIEAVGAAVLGDTEDPGHRRRLLGHRR